MVTIRFHGDTEYKNGLLSLHLKKGDQVEMTEAIFTQMRKDIGIVRYRSEVEVISPPKLRQVKDYFKA